MITLQKVNLSLLDQSHSRFLLSPSPFHLAPRSLIVRSSPKCPCNNVSLAVIPSHTRFVRTQCSLRLRPSSHLVLVWGCCSCDLIHACIMRMYESFTLPSGLHPKLCDAHFASLGRRHSPSTHSTSCTVYSILERRHTPSRFIDRCRRFPSFFSALELGVETGSGSVFGGEPLLIKTSPGTTSTFSSRIATRVQRLVRVYF